MFVPPVKIQQATTAYHVFINGEFQYLLVNGVRHYPQPATIAQIVNLNTNLRPKGPYYV